MSFLDKIKDSNNPNASADEEAHHEAATTQAGAGEHDTAAPSTLHPVGADSSIISEAAPSELPGDFGDTRLRADAGIEEATSLEPNSGLPIIGRWSLGRQQRALLIMLLVGGVGLGVAAFVSVKTANERAAQIGAVGRALTQSQRLAKSVSQA